MNKEKGVMCIVNGMAVITVDAAVVWDAAEQKAAHRGDDKRRRPSFHRARPHRGSRR